MVLDICGDKMTKISVIIPIYNGSRYIAECVEKIQKQTLKELEIVCVDDGSVDDSLFILRQMQKGDKRIHILEQENQGAGSARNLALRNAAGEFVCFLDVDDYFMSDNALEEMYRQAVSQGVSICGGQFYQDFEGKIQKVSVYGDLWNDTQHGRLLEYLDYQQDFYFSNYLYSRRMLLDQNIVFPIYRQFEDPPFCVKALFAARQIYITDIPFYCYRVGYKERSYNEQMALDQMKGMTDNLHFSRKNGLKRLHRITYYRIINSCRRELKSYCQKRNRSFVELLEETERSICWEWLEEKCRIQEKSLKTVYNAPDGRNNEGEWIFPYDEVKHGDRIVLYGAGKVGRDYHRQICRDRKVSLSAWVDGNAHQIRECDGTEVVSPECLGDISFDHIVIAIANMMVALEVMDTLGLMGIAPEKVIWDIGR